MQTLCCSHSGDSALLLIHFDSYKGWSISNEKNTQLPSKSFNYLKHNFFEDQYTFPIMLQCFYSFNEKILTLLFNPLIYGHNDGFIRPQKHANGAIP